MTASVQLTPITEILAFGNNPWHKVKFAKTSYSEFLLGEITKSSAQSNAKYDQILMYLLL
jgi:hypothetical protein